MSPPAAEMLPGPAFPQLPAALPPARRPLPTGPAGPCAPSQVGVGTCMVHLCQAVLWAFSSDRELTQPSQWLFHRWGN